MFRHLSRKQAYILMATVIVFCLASLVGTTIALFFNASNDGTIGVVTPSGDVAIDIVDTSGATLQKKALLFITDSGGADGNEVLFEPGATFYTQGFKVKNMGDVPVNFSLSVSKDEKIDMKAFNEAFELWIAKEGDDFSTAEKITEFKVNGLAAGKSSETYHLFVKMKESAGNEFQDKTYTGIGVTVYAVQSNPKLD